MDRSRRIVICLTPVKNEAWILEQFLRCASLWADYIVIADQNSDDHSREIAKRCDKVILIENPSCTFNEPERQKLLIEAARKIPGPRLLVGLDADEFLTPNFATSREWELILNAPEGTVIKIPCAQIKPDMKHYWRTPDGAIGYVDDGYKHSGNLIHSPRIPLPANAPETNLKEIFLMHYQYVDWERMRSKHRWYQCWERMNYPERSAIDIFRQYHHMFGIKDKESKEIPAWWLDGYSTYGIDMRNVSKERYYWWDQEILKIMANYETKPFRREYIWDVHWDVMACQYGYENPARFHDPRSLFEKMVHGWLLRTQRYKDTIAIKLLNKVLKQIFGW